jgi:colanic acid/amylovoran biosynthesis glycosyltransferase
VTGPWHGGSAVAPQAEFDGLASGTETDLPAVGQLFNVYLPITMNWLYDQLRFVRQVRNVVLATWCRSCDQFPSNPCYGALEGSFLYALRSHVRRVVFGYYSLHETAALAEKLALLHAHSGLVGAASLRLAQRLHLPLLTSFYGCDLGRDQDHMRPLYRELFLHGTAFIVEGEAARGHLIALGCPPDRILIHRIGVDVNSIRPVDRGIIPGRLRVLMAGRFTEKKGMRYGLQAFAKVAQDCPGYQLTIVGGASGTCPGERMAHENYMEINRLGLADRVHFTGMLTPRNFREELTRHDVLLHPSVVAGDGDCESGLPITILEAAATAMPTIASRHCDIPDAVRPGETGWLAEERDVAGLADALFEAMRDPRMCKRYGANARTLVERSYDARICTLDSIYTEYLPHG